MLNPQTADEGAGSRPASRVQVPLLAALSGAGAGLGQAPWNMWYLAVPALIFGLLAFRRAHSPASAALCGWLFGLIYFAVALFWLLEPFQVEAELYGWMAPFALAGMAGGLALFWALAFWGGKRLGSFWPIVPLWALAELARGYVLTGFPWALVGYLWADSAVVHWVSIVGPYGLTALTIAVAACIVEGWSRLGLSALGYMLAPPAALLAGAVVLAPSPILPESDGPVVRLVQPNAAQRDKWKPDLVPVFFQRQIDYTSVSPKPDLIVWPETALPMLLENAGEAFAVVSDATGGAPAVIGIQRREADRFYNSLVVMDGQGVLASQYDKHHLVPFGEYMPARQLFARFDILGLAARAEAGYTAGPGPRLIEIDGIGRALPLICYEAVFPQYPFKTERPDLLLQITNDAWFGQHSGPYQHLAQARIRSIEQGLPMVRVANTGVSAVIDGRGRIVASLPLGQAGFVDAALPPALSPTIYSRIGDLPVLVILLFLASAAIWTKRRNRR